MIATFDVTEKTSVPIIQLTSWDFDGNGAADALTDGLLLLPIHSICVVVN